MALRLGDLVVCGEIINTRKYSTHGWIGLKDQDRPLLLQLTGDCDPDLAGRHIRFEARLAHNQEGTGTSHPHEQPADLSALAWQQVGPTGTITAARQVLVAECSPEELVARSELGEPPPTEWKRCLYLEWHGQNGRVVIELVDPVIEFVEPGSEEFALDAADDEFLDGSGNGSLELGDMDDVLSGGDDLEPDDDSWGLIPDELERQFEADALETDWNLSDEDDGPPDSIRELELMDELIERGEGEIIGTLFESPKQFPLPDQLDDVQAEQALKSLLTELALYGIALDICEHFTPCDAYRLLLEEICRKERAFPELRQTQWVQHFMTSEFCPECEAEIEREFEEEDRRRRRDDPDDLPF